MRVLSWNLYHGRAKPPAGRPLEREFCDLLAGWAWDVALLQEVPPWWGPMLAGACDAEERTALTSRNGLLPLRRFVADRRPDLIKSNGGGANVILVRGAEIAEHRVCELRAKPERRVCHAVLLASGTWVGNLHAQVRPHDLTRADVARAAWAMRAWAGEAPAVLGGDFNVPEPRPEGFDVLAGENVDHIAARGFVAAGAVQLPRRGRLSDHRPVLLEVAPA